MPRSSPGSSSRRRHRHRHRSLWRKVGDAAADFWLWLSAGPKHRHRRKRTASRMAVDAWTWVTTLPRRHPGLPGVLVADVLITYLYALAVYALMPRAPHAPSAAEMMAQPWAYVYVAPVAVLAAVLGGGQVVQAWARHPRWWRLAPEAAGIGAVATFLITAPRAAHPLTAPVARAVMVMAALSVGLGVVLTVANYTFARALRPRTRRRRRSGSSAVPETPPPAAATD